jgi:hypothetical protein
MGCILRKHKLFAADDAVIDNAIHRIAAGADEGSIPHWGMLTSFDSGG